jgi:hypothetical protein
MRNEAGGASAGAGEALRRELGTWAGVVAEKSGDVRECARAGPRRAQGESTAQREKRGHAGQWLSDWRTGPARQRERRSVRVKKPMPIGWPQRAEGERERERAGEKVAADRRGPPVRQRGRAAWLGQIGLLGCFSFFFFSLDFLIPFLFLFSRIFNSKFKLGFKFK